MFSVDMEGEPCFMGVKVRIWCLVAVSVYSFLAAHHSEHQSRETHEMTRANTMALREIVSLLAKKQVAAPGELHLAPEPEKEETNAVVHR